MNRIEEIKAAERRVAYRKTLGHAHIPEMTTNMLPVPEDHEDELIIKLRAQLEDKRRHRRIIDIEDI